MGTTPQLRKNSCERGQSCITAYYRYKILYFFNDFNPNDSAFKNKNGLPIPLMICWKIYKPCTLISPLSLSSFKFFHAHSFQFLVSFWTGVPSIPLVPVSPGSPFCPLEPWTPVSPFAPCSPGGPVGPVIPGDPWFPSRPSRPSRPGIPGEPDLPCVPGWHAQQKEDGFEWNDNLSYTKRKF